MNSSLPNFDELVAGYHNTAEGNDALFRRLTAATWSDPLLTAHRRHIETHQLGFGDPAFHTLWAALLPAAAQRFGPFRALEIGVFKGQVISLWSLLAREKNLPLSIEAITPLVGEKPPKPGLLTKVRFRLDRAFRERVQVGNFYPEHDYAGIIARLFRHFDLDPAVVTFHRGYSTDAALLRRLEQASYQIVYVDGDHSYAGALHDFTTFGPKVPKGGWLIADDAGFDLPGTAFWKGYEPVTRACAVLPSLGFRNVLNVGHNRIFEKVT
jgi:predicted O-methyltransferase YrrM